MAAQITWKRSGSPQTKRADMYGGPCEHDDPVSHWLLEWMILAYRPGRLTAIFFVVAGAIEPKAWNPGPLPHTFPTSFIPFRFGFGIRETSPKSLPAPNPRSNSKIPCQI